MNYSYYVHRYLFLLQKLTSACLLLVFTRRLHSENMARYMSFAFVRKVNIRSFAICLFFAQNVLFCVSALLINSAKYAHGHFLNVFTQRVRPVPVLFYAHGNYIAYNVGLALQIVANTCKGSCVVLLLGLYLPQAVKFVKDRAKITGIMTVRQYRLLLAYALLKVLLCAVAMCFVDGGGGAGGDSDTASFVAGVIFAVEGMLLGIAFRSVARRIADLKAPELLTLQPTDPTARRPIAFADKMILDSGVDDSLSCIHAHLTATTRRLGSCLAVEGAAFGATTLLLCATAARDDFLVLRDAFCALQFVAAAASSLLVGLLLMPLARLDLVLHANDSVRLTNIESLFWRPSLFLMDSEWRDRIRAERLKRLAALQNFPLVAAQPSSSTAAASK